MTNRNNRQNSKQQRQTFSNNSKRSNYGSYEINPNISVENEVRYLIDNGLF